MPCFITQRVGRVTVIAPVQLCEGTPVSPRASPPAEEVAPSDDSKHRDRLRELGGHARPPSPQPPAAGLLGAARGGGRLPRWGLLRGCPSLRDVPTIPAKEGGHLSPGGTRIRVDRQGLYTPRFIIIMSTRGRDGCRGALPVALASRRLSQLVCTVRDDTARFVSGSRRERDVRQNSRIACLCRCEQRRGGHHRVAYAGPP